MKKEEIIDLLKKKEAEYIEASKEDHSNNTEVLSNYNYGVAVGLRMAISIIGMLNKSNTTNINFDFKKFSEFIDEKLRKEFSYIPFEVLSKLAKLAYIHFKKDISTSFCDEEDYLSKKFRDISRNNISTIIELIYDYIVNMKSNKETFISYIKKYCNTLVVEKTIEGTTFLNRDGKDWGNINDDSLELFPNVVFCNPSSVDDFIDFAEEKEPIKTYSNFIKENDRRR